LVAAGDNSEVRLAVSGVIGQHYRLEFSDGIPTAGTWQMLAEWMSLTTSPLIVTQAISHPARLYRAVSLP
jgi:hypothetical protein